MVNLGPSKGCHRCRLRRVLCDRTRPICNRCVAIGATECGRYQVTGIAKVIFKNYTTTATGLSQLDPKRKQPRLTSQDPCHHVVSVLRDLPEDEERLAFGFFLNTFITPNPYVKSQRGCFDNIIPAISTAKADSPVVLAFSALAIQMYSQWRPGSLESYDWSKIRLIQALGRLQQALDDPIESKSQSTLIATLLLQLRENVKSVWRLQKVSRTHQNGALVLARHQAQAGFDHPDSKNIFHRLITIEVASATREGRPVPEDLRGWCDEDNTP